MWIISFFHVKKKEHQFIRSFYLDYDNVSEVGIIDIILLRKMYCNYTCSQCSLHIENDMVFKINYKGDVSKVMDES